MKADQFLKKYIEENSEQGIFKRMLQDQLDNPDPSFDADSLDLTVPEMAPGRPYYPGQDIRRDQYIRQYPRSGIAGVMGNPELVAGSPSFDLSYPRGPGGSSYEGIPNANDPLMKKKLRGRVLTNPEGKEMLPGFLGGV